MSSTSCKAFYVTVNGSDTSRLPGLPATTFYSYTTVPSLESNFEMQEAVSFGLDILGSSVAKYLNLTVPACTSKNGGAAPTLKVGITQLLSQTTTLVARNVPAMTSQSANTSTPAVLENKAGGGLSAGSKVGRGVGVGVGALLNVLL